MFKKEQNFYKIAVLGAVLEGLYCIFMSWLLPTFGHLFGSDQNSLSMVVFLLVLVFSVALSGFLILGYPVYLAIQQKYKEAIIGILVSLVTLLAVLLLTFGSILLLT
ncbi:MAG: hypothetical protein NTZ18_01325 [Candidatus Komeilibacteria bacterium]|nr:hypothetical protein [Candidatus Komeilibacteria bacterium]